jgi:hypothetical protein
MQLYIMHLFLQNALHVAVGSSTHHQELKNYAYNIWYLLSCNDKFKQLSGKNVYMLLYVITT